MGLDQPLAVKFAEGLQRTIGQTMAVAGEAVDMVDAAIIAAVMTDMPALGQHVQHTLLAP